MLKLLFWLILALVVGLFFAVRQANRLRAAQRKDAPEPRALESVRCAHCGMFVPEDKAVRREGEDFCSWEHAQARADARAEASDRETE
ncbi:MAG: PP0621 family protein [Guyparkeria sp.]|uniref:PP0621 family protein n=1 Tax=Guyparkeria sp. TaxID=2035736 RepID=UPI00397A5030